LQGINITVIATGANISISSANIGLVGVIEARALESKSIVPIISSSSCVFLVILKHYI
jgi:hypothetical protein